MHFGSQGMRRKEFTLDGTDGNYASEVLYLGPSNEDDAEDLDVVDALRAVVNQLPSGQIEVDVLEPGKNPQVEGNWHKNVVTWTATGLQSLEELVAMQVRIRAKSGTTSGTAIVTVGWRA